MKVSLMKKCISFFIVLFVLTNCLVLSFNDQTNSAMKYSSLEQILFVVNSPIDILSKMTQPDKTTQKDNNKKEQKQNSYFYECLLPIEITIPTVFNIGNLLSADISSFVTENFVADVEYPIKIPFLQFIFLLLLLKLIFSILKRSISINYNMINIDKRACIV